MRQSSSAVDLSNTDCSLLWYASQPLTRHALSPVSGYKCQGFGRQRQQPIWDHRGVRPTRPNATAGMVHRHLDIWIAPRLASCLGSASGSALRRSLGITIRRRFTPVAALSGTLTSSQRQA
jgi:hypothetical protein